MKMKKSVITSLSALAAILLALALWAGSTLFPPVSLTAQAEEDAGAYSYEIQAFDVVMDVSADRTVQVNERITVLHTGYDSHGIIRDLPLGNGVTYKNFTAKSDNSDFYYYSQDDSSDFLSVYLRGDKVITNQLRTYTLNYTMSVPKLSEEGYLPLDVVGYGWQTNIQNVSVTVTLPQGLNEYKVYSGRYGATSNQYAQIKKEGEVIYITAELLPKGVDGNAAGITLDLSFNAGVLSSNFDFSLLWAAAIAVVLIVSAIVAKKLFCHPPVLVAPVNFTAPEEMDPLRMGKLIDNSVDGEDIGALVFWFADQGYLTIDLTNESDPLLKRTGKLLPPDAPAYQRRMYEGLFSKGNEVYISSLKDKFYTTADAVRLSVPSVAGGVYDKKTVGMPVFFGLLTVLLCGALSFIFSKTVIADYFYWFPFIASAFAFIFAAVGQILCLQYEHKWKKSARVGVSVITFIVGVLFGFMGFLIPSAVFGGWTVFLLTVGAAITGFVAGGTLCRSKEYTEKLGQIVGFKNFILYTEKDKIKFMLQDNPDFYYHILPYAQVLGVTDEWTDKFKGLAASAPSYVRYDAGDRLLDYLFWRSMFRSLNTNMTANMVSRPSQSGGGVNGGGFGGGFGGGGFGGGGGRGC